MKNAFATIAIAAVALIGGGSANVRAADIAPTATATTAAPGCAYVGKLGFREAKGTVNSSLTFTRLVESQAKRILPISKDATVRVSSIDADDARGWDHGDVAVFVDTRDGNVVGQAVIMATQCGPVARLTLESFSTSLETQAAPELPSPIAPTNG